jgi:hypothetical protein
MRSSPALALVVGLFLTAPLARAEEFDSKGVAIHFTAEGKGEPVVLVHGLGSSGAINWQLPGTVKLLAARYRVIALDCRGHGQSGKPSEERQYGVEMVEDIVRLLDHLKIEKAHVVGYSMGGMITLKVVVLHPDRVKSAVLGGMGWLKSGSPLQRFWEKVPDREDSLIPPACMRGISQLGVTEDEVKAVKVPVSVIVGDRDPCRKLYVDPLLRLRPEWPLTSVEGAGHLNCILKESFKEAVGTALEAQAGP